MKVRKIGNTTIITPETPELAGFATELMLDNFPKGNNVVIDLSAAGKIVSKDLNVFSEVIKFQKQQKKSLVFVADTDYNKTGKYVVVPSLQEAHDLIEMDEIERDLGF